MTRVTFAFLAGLVTAALLLAFLRLRYLFQRHAVRDGFQLHGYGSQLG